MQRKNINTIKSANSASSFKFRHVNFPQKTSLVTWGFNMLIKYNRFLKMFTEIMDIFECTLP